MTTLSTSKFKRNAKQPIPWLPSGRRFGSWIDGTQHEHASEPLRPVPQSVLTLQSSRQVIERNLTADQTPQRFLQQYVSQYSRLLGASLSTVTLVACGSGGSGDANGNTPVPDPTTDFPPPDPSGDDPIPDPTGEDSIPDPTGEDSIPDPTGEDSIPVPVDGDTTRPSVTLTTAVAKLTSAPFTVNVQFNEPVIGFTLDDVAVSGANLTDLTGTDASYAFTASANGGNFTASIAPDQVTDIAGNGNINSNALSVDDLQAPTVVIHFPTPRTMTDGESVTVRGSADDLSEITEISVNGTVATSTDGFTNWQAVVPLQGGRNALSVTVSDAVGNSDEIAGFVRVDRQDPVLQSAVDIVIDEANDRALIIDDSINALVEVDLNSNLRTVISDSTRPNADNALITPTGLVLDANNNRVLVIDVAIQALIAIDLDSGQRTIISQHDDADAVPMIRPLDVELDAGSNRVFVADAGQPAVLVIDLTSGERTVLSDNSGPESRMGVLSRLALDINGNRLFVLDDTFASVYVVNLSDGLRSLYSGGTFPTGANQLQNPVGMIYDSNLERLYVSDSGLDAVLWIGGVIGLRNVISSPAVPAGGANPLLTPMSLALLPGGEKFWVTDISHGIVQVDVATGHRGIFSNCRTPDALNIFDNAKRMTLDAAQNRLLVANAGVSNAGRDEIVSVDIATGSRRILSNATIPNADNPLFNPKGVVLDSANNRVLVTEGATVNQNTLWAVDLDSGVRTILSDENSFSDGAPFGAALIGALDVDNNRLFVISNETDEMLAINLSDGSRTLISSNTVPNATNAFIFPSGMVFDVANQRLLVTNAGTDSLLAVDVVSGVRTIVSDNATPTNPLERPTALALDANNNRVFMLDSNGDATSSVRVYAVDLFTGQRSIVSEQSEPGSVNRTYILEGLALDAKHQRLFVNDHRIVYVVDAVTGDRVVLSR